MRRTPLTTTPRRLPEGAIIVVIIILFLPNNSGVTGLPGARAEAVKHTGIESETLCSIEWPKYCLQKLATNSSSSLLREATGDRAAS